MVNTVVNDDGIHQPVNINAQTMQYLQHLWPGSQTCLGLYGQEQDKLRLTALIGRLRAAGSFFSPLRAAL